VKRWCVIGTLALVQALAGCASSGSQVDSGLWHHNAGLSNQAIPRLLSGVPALERSNPADPRLPTAYVALGDLASADRSFDAADGFYKKALQSARTYHPANATLNRNARVHGGNFLRAQGRNVEAIPLLTEAVAISEGDASMPRILYAIDLDNLSVAYGSLPDDARAQQLSQRALDVLDGIEQTHAVKATRGVVLYNAAYRLAEKGQDAQAETYYRQSLAAVSAYGEKWRARVVRDAYATLLRKMGREAEAAALDAKP